VIAAGSKGGAEVYVANALWTQMGLQTLPAFQATVKNLYEAGLTPLDFKTTPETARMTIKLAFSLHKANFSGIATGTPLALSAVIHKAFVDVNEKGTEAAAATAVTIVTVSAAPPEEKIAVFRADHPFFFAIRDNGTGSLLFAGRLVNPQAM
jgi:serine protease inhibitor